MKEPQIKRTPSAGAMNMPKQVNIKKADNGYIVSCNDYEENSEIRIAKTLNEAHKISKEMMGEKENNDKNKGD